MNTIIKNVIVKQFKSYNGELSSQQPGNATVIPDQCNKSFTVTPVMIPDLDTAYFYSHEAEDIFLGIRYGTMICFLWDGDLVCDSVYNVNIVALSSEENMGHISVKRGIHDGEFSLLSSSKEYMVRIGRNYFHVNGSYDGENMSLHEYRHTGRSQELTRFSPIIGEGT